jgi:hypothetical protein
MTAPSSDQLSEAARRWLLAIISLLPGDLIKYQYPYAVIFPEPLKKAYQELHKLEEVPLIRDVLDELRTWFLTSSSDYPWGDIGISRRNKIVVWKKS